MRTRDKFSFDLFLTSLASLSNAAALFGFFMLAAQVFTVDSFGRFQAARNIALSVVPILCFGLAVALPKVLAGLIDKSAVIRNALAVHLILVFLIVGLGLLVTALAPTGSGESENIRIFVLAIPLMIGVSSTRVLESVLRGMGMILACNMIRGPFNICVVGLSLTSIAVGADWQVALLILGSGYSVASVFLLSIWVWLLMRPKFHESEAHPQSFFWKFGLERTPAGFLKSFIFSFPFIASSVAQDFETAAICGVIIFYLRGAEALASSFGPSLIYRSSLRAKTLGRHSNSHLTAGFGEITFIFSIITSSLLATWSYEVVALTFGDSYAQWHWFVALSGLALIPHCMYVTLRSFVDGIYDQPYNTFNAALACAFQLVACLLLSMLVSTQQAILLAFILSVVLLGLLTVYSLRHSLSAVRVRETLSPALIFAFCLTSLNVILKALWPEAFYIYIFGMDMLLTLLFFLLMGPKFKFIISD